MNRRQRKKRDKRTRQWFRRMVMLLNKIGKKQNPHFMEWVA